MIYAKLISVLRWSLLAAPIALLSLATPVTAQTYAYEYEKAEHQRVRALIKELERFIDRAESAEAADPNFLRDLRLVLDRYRASKALPGATVLFDDFTDGDYTRNPDWIVMSGGFHVDGARGLMLGSVSYPHSGGAQSPGGKQVIAVGEVLDERGWSIPGSGEQLRSFFDSLTNNPRFTVSRLPAGMIPSDIVVIGRVVANGIRRYAGKLEVELILEARFQHSGRIVRSQGFGKKNVPSNAFAQRYIAEAVRRAIENAGPRLYVEIESSRRLEYGPPPYNFAFYGQAGEIYTRASIKNAFRMRAELSAHRNDGEAILGVYQRRRPTSGYRLAILPGRIEIRAVSPRGTRVVEFAAAPLNLADGRRHNIEWRRGKRGDMSVRVDGQQVLQTRDRGFRDSFDGFTYATNRGDYALRSVRIDVKGRDDH